MIWASINPGAGRRPEWGGCDQRFRGYWRQEGARWNEMDRDMPFLLQYENVAWYENGKVRILDRRIYPTEVRFVECATYQEVVQAIADMVTQSAGPYTAVGMGMALAAWQVRDKGAAEQDAFLQQAAYDPTRPPHHRQPVRPDHYRCRCGEGDPGCGPIPFRPSWHPPWSPEPPVQHHADRGRPSGELIPMAGHDPDPVLRRNHHRHRDPGRHGGRTRPSRPTARRHGLIYKGPAHLRLLRPDGV